ncbi:hypothetical protein DYBT9275_03360 [Dyadobacter sp. CECT 9275]|uniref:Uncharacterized protein n=1 Tax=Dyadobacter helix TaxID=2822344 RepID=A0A916JG04_9BACT|nr:hypothetical protein DYBT9275_03360 [Dyadobacter sp. CECT 9275]
MLAGTGFWLWGRFGPSTHIVYAEKATDLPIAITIDSASHSCDLTVRRYRQIGKELQFELAANAGGLAPYDVEIFQNGSSQQFKGIPHRYGTWLSIPETALKSGEAQIKVTSLGLSGCVTSASFQYNAGKNDEILAQDKWIRQGSKDNWLDVRPVVKNGRIFLKDFGNYNDGRTKVVMIDGIAVKALENGIEVKPGYLYSVTARWIDAPYNDWWNKMRNRSVRQQNIWVGRLFSDKNEEANGLTRIGIPEWFSPSKATNVEFDTKFPEFQPIEGKLVMQYRLNDYVPDKNYFNRGIRYLHSGDENLPAMRQHWTATPNTFSDRDEKWFASLSQQEVEALPGIPDFAVYAFDFEFWSQRYPPEVLQRLIWFTRKLKRDHPNTLIFDYWGGGAYLNPHINTLGSKKPMDFVKDYENPLPNTTNFDPLPNGDSFRNLFGITPIDVYPKAMFGKDENGNTPNNFVLLSAIHSLRINKLIPFQKNNKSIFYAWNRYMPLYDDPIVPWHLRTTNPKGELVMNQLEMMPASQALSMSLFSLILFDGYYLWHDGGRSGNDPNGYWIPEKGQSFGYDWFPDDGKSDISALKKQVPNGPTTPGYWDFPTEFYALGNWMAKQTEDILTGGTNVDLAYEKDNAWVTPRKEQVLLAMDGKDPFITAVVNEKKIAVLAVDSFQQPNATRKVKIRLPDHTETYITLYGNWPSLYRGTMR